MTNVDDDIYYKKKSWTIAGKHKKVGKGKFQFNVGASKGFALYRHSEFGTDDMNEGVMVKATSLHREVALRIASCMVGHEFRLLKEKGMFNWPAYKENRPCIVRALTALNNSRRRYKECRLKDGYFYLNMNPHKYAMSVRSPLFTMPREDAVKKINLLRRKRQAVSRATNASLDVQGSNSYSKVAGNTKVLQMMLIYGCVIALAYIIIYV